MTGTIMGGTRPHTVSATLVKSSQPSPCQRPSLCKTAPVVGVHQKRHSFQVLHAIAAPEGIRQQLELGSLDLEDPVTAFSQEDFDKFLKGYQSQYNELSTWIKDVDIEGTIPAELQGTLLRNGPGLLEVGGKALSQPLDGDGMVCKFAFKDGKVHFQNKYIRTEALIKEQAAGKMLYRGVFSVGNPSGGLFFNPFDFNVKNVANTGVMHWGNKLLALYESDLPYQLDHDLKTTGRTTLDGAIDTDKQRFGAHYRFVTEPDGSKRLIGFNFTEGAQGGTVHFWEFDEKFNQISKTKHEMPGGAFGFIHDILVTDQHYVVLENPIKMNFAKLLTKYAFAKACLAECLEYEGTKPTKIHVIPRPGKHSSFLGQKSAGVYETPAFFSFHHVNAFEASQQCLVVDTVALTGINFSNSFESGASMFEKPGKGVLTRLVIDGKTGQVARHPVLGNRACEFPAVGAAVVGKPHQHAYIGSSRVTGETNWGPIQVIAKVTLPAELGTETAFDANQANTEVWDAGPDQFAQEPIFCPRPEAHGEDDGWILTMVYDCKTDRSHLVILDAQKVQAGPVARIKLPHRIPYGLHGSFTAAFLGPSRGEEQHCYDIRSGVGTGSHPKYS